MPSEIQQPWVEHRATAVLENLGGKVRLDDIIFVDDTYRANSITTLPSTFPDGDLWYTIYLNTVAARRDGKTPREILSMYNYPRHLVQKYYSGVVPVSGKSVNSAMEEKILPFGFSNPNINNLNALFSLVFWSGSIGKAVVEVVSNCYTRNPLEKILGEIGYTNADASSNSGANGSHNFRAYDNTYYICSAALARSFGLLGLPLNRHDKSKMADFGVPWYARFIAGDFFNYKQGFDDASNSKAEDFLRTFCYALLADKTQPRFHQDGLRIPLISTFSEEVGINFSMNIAEIMKKAFVELEISRGNIVTTKKGEGRSSYFNRINLTRDEAMYLHSLLRNLTGQCDGGSLPLNLDVRRMAGQLLSV